MEYLYGEHWEEQAQCSEATRKYVERIHEVGQNEPELLVAHAYTRYMGTSRGPGAEEGGPAGPETPSTGKGPSSTCLRMWTTHSSSSSCTGPG